MRVQLNRLECSTAPCLTFLSLTLFFALNESWPRLPGFASKVRVCTNSTKAAPHGCQAERMTTKAFRLGTQAERMAPRRFASKTPRVKNTR